MIVTRDVNQPRILYEDKNVDGGRQNSPSNYRPNKGVQSHPEYDIVNLQICVGFSFRIGSKTKSSRLVIA